MQNFIYQFRLIPNQITGIRFILILLMWAAALLNIPFLIGIGLFLAGLTDFLDGFLARRMKQVSEFGSKLDSLADNHLFISVFIWILLFHPEVFFKNLAIILFALLINGVSLFVGWRKFNRFANLHLFSSKAAALTAYIFLIHLFLFGYHPLIFIFTISIYILSSLEALLIQLMMHKVDEHMGSIFFKIQELGHPSIKPH